MAWYTNPKIWSFVGGIGAAAVGAVVCKADKTRELTVAAVAKGMQVQAKANEGLQSLKDDAADLAEEARRKAELDAERADRRAAIEARIREQVEAEMAAEDEKAAKEAEAEEAAAAKKTTARKTAAKKTAAK